MTFFPFIQRLIIILATLVLSASAKLEKPNVLLIAVDDLNDWIGALGGHPQAKTPNIDRLAKKGVLFANAHCQSPVCNPSRASLMSSTYPETSGIYFLSPSFASSPIAKKRTMMPVRFREEGYHTSAAGKLYHHKENKEYFDNYAGSFGGFGPFPRKKLSPYKGMKLWDWGVFPENDDTAPDHKIAHWGAQQLKQKFDKPFFMGVGFYRPHVPQYAPPKWFDLYPLETLQLPVVPRNDLSDLSRYATNITRLKHVAPTHAWVSQADEWKPLVQSYLACISFVDAQVGKILDALEESPHADNTFVVLFSDHGFHLGEKERWAKRSLWEDSTHVPLIITGPGVPEGKRCQKPVELLDIYPTLLELTGLKEDARLEGNSLVPLIKNTKAEWPHIARTSFGLGNCSIRSEQYRYIRYHDGSEEFYDHSSDPHEWKNLINQNKVKTLVQQHRALLPKTHHPILGKGSTGHQSYQASKDVIAE